MKSVIKKRGKLPKLRPCWACQNLPKYERILGDHNRVYYEYDCPICEPDGPAQETLREARTHWNARQWAMRGRRMAHTLATYVDRRGGRWIARNDNGDGIGLYKKASRKAVVGGWLKLGWCVRHGTQFRWNDLAGNQGVIPYSDVGGVLVSFADEILRRKNED